METFYEIWNTESRNRFGEYDTQGEAIEAVRRVLAINGENAVHKLALNSDDGSGHGSIIALGAGLIELAKQDMPAPTQNTIQGNNPPKASVIKARSSSAMQTTQGIEAQHRAILASFDPFASLRQALDTWSASMTLKAISTASAAIALPSATDAMLRATEINWHTHLFPEPERYRKFLDDIFATGHYRKLMEEYDTGLRSMAAQLAQVVTPDLDYGVYTFLLETPTPAIVILDHRPEEDDLITALVEDPQAGRNIVYFEQWLADRSRRLRRRN